MSLHPIANQYLGKSSLGSRLYFQLIIVLSLCSSVLGAATQGQEHLRHVRQLPDQDDNENFPLVRLRLTTHPFWNPKYTALLELDLFQAIMEMADAYAKDKEEGVNSGHWDSIVDAFDDGDMKNFWTYDAARAFYFSSMILFPEVAYYEIIGHSYEERPIDVFSLRDDSFTMRAPKPNILFTSLHHAREVMSLQMNMFVFAKLVHGYLSNEADSHFLVQTRNNFFVPFVNPDGYSAISDYFLDEEKNPKHSLTRIRKNRHASPAKDCDWTKLGVDINRNYGFKWGFDDEGSSTDPCDEAYRGTEPFSEPETRAMRSLANKYNFKWAFNYHAFGPLYVYPYGYDGAYNDHLPFEFLEIFKEFEKECDLKDAKWGNARQTVNYPANGEAADWLLNEYGTFAFSPELASPSAYSKQFFPRHDAILPVLEYNLPAAIRGIWKSGPQLLINEIDNSRYFERGDLFEYVLLSFVVENVGLQDSYNTGLKLDVIANSIPPHVDVEIFQLHETLSIADAQYAHVWDKDITQFDHLLGKMNSDSFLDVTVDLGVIKKRKARQFFVVLRHLFEQDLFVDAHQDATYTMRLNQSDFYIETFKFEKKQFVVKPFIHRFTKNPLRTFDPKSDDNDTDDSKKQKKLLNDLTSQLKDKWKKMDKKDTKKIVSQATKSLLDMDSDKLKGSKSPEEFVKNLPDPVKRDAGFKSDEEANEYLKTHSLKEFAGRSKDLDAYLQDNPEAKQVFDEKTHEFEVGTGYKVPELKTWDQKLQEMNDNPEMYNNMGDIRTYLPEDMQEETKDMSDEELSEYLKNSDKFKERLDKDPELAQKVDNVIQKGQDEVAKRSKEIFNTTWEQIENVVISGDMQGFWSREGALKMFYSYLKSFPNFVKLHKFGKSYENRDMLAFRVSNYKYRQTVEKPAILFTSLHHAREPMGLSMNLYVFARLMFDIANGNPQTMNWVGTREIFFVPFVNPDGYDRISMHFKVHGKLLPIRKNRRPSECSDDTMGVDLNRNYGYKWGADNEGSSNKKCAEDYRGASAFSEPETQSMRDLVNKNPFTFATNYHAYGNMYVIPYNFERKDKSKTSEQAQIYKEYHEETGLGDTAEWGNSAHMVNYPCNGGAADWMLHHKNIIAMSPELGTQSGPDQDFYPPEESILPVLRHNIQAALAAVEKGGISLTLLEAAESRHAQWDEEENSGILAFQFLFSNSGLGESYDRVNFTLGLDMVKDTKGIKDITILSKDEDTYSADFEHSSQLIDEDLEEIPSTFSCDKTSCMAVTFIDSIMRHSTRKFVVLIKKEFKNQKDRAKGFTTVKSYSFHADSENGHDYQSEVGTTTFNYNGDGAVTDNGSQTKQGVSNVIYYLGGVILVSFVVVFIVSFIRGYKKKVNAYGNLEMVRETDRSFELTPAV